MKRGSQMHPARASRGLRSVVMGEGDTDAPGVGLLGRSPSMLFSVRADGLGSSAFMQKGFPQWSEYLDFLCRLNDLDTVFNVGGNGVGVAGG